MLKLPENSKYPNLASLYNASLRQAKLKDLLYPLFIFFTLASSDNDFYRYYLCEKGWYLGSPKEQIFTH